MRPMEKDWYRRIWTLDIQDQSWVEDTKRQVDFLISALHLRGGERVLDLACGFGRHALELARRGYDVTGIDITPEYIRHASAQAEKEGLRAHFFCKDIRELTYCQEFDVVLNLADGAIGYLEDDQENHKIFEVVSRALKPEGQHFCDIMNGSYADLHFPCQLWDAGEKGLTLSRFEWDRATRTLLYGQLDYSYGQPLRKPELDQGNVIRLYTLTEIQEILSGLGMEITASYGSFSGIPSSDAEIQLLVCSRKR